MSALELLAVVVTVRLRVALVDTDAPLETDGEGVPSAIAAVLLPLVILPVLVVRTTDDVKLGILLINSGYERVH